MAGEPPEDSPDAAKAARDAAAAATSAAEKARTAAEDAETVTAEARKAAESINEDLRFRKLTTVLPILIDIAILAVLAFQGSMIFRQTSNTESSVELTREQMDRAANISRFEILKDLEGDTIEIQDIVHAEYSVFDRGNAVGCDPLPTVTQGDEKDLHRIIAHYEKYHQAAQLGLITESRWGAICRGARELFQNNCLLADQWESTYQDRVTQKFRNSFIPGCQLAN